ncbi:MAG: hypothetical protein ACLGXA_03615 [Acidobacteriota bacterium]
MRLLASSLLLALATPIALAQLPVQPISASDAAKHIGENRTVCGAIVNEHIASSSRGTPTFVDIDQAYPNQVFDLVIWGDKKADVGNFPKSGNVCASGTIMLYRGHAEIFLEDWHSWYVPNNNPQRAAMR